MWNTLDTILGASKSKPLPNNISSAQDFLDFFIKKVEAVRKETGQGPATTFLPPAAATFSSFQLCTEDNVAKVITVAPSKSCELDPIPTNILKQFLLVLMPYITKMCNASIQRRTLPTTQRSAIVAPRLKKTGSDPADVCNYRPISNLTFMVHSCRAFGLSSTRRLPGADRSSSVFQTYSLLKGAVYLNWRSQGRR